MIIKPEPEGHKEISRTFLIKPTMPPSNHRELVNVNWSHPAYANRHISARNDEEIIAASLAVDCCPLSADKAMPDTVLPP